MGEPSQVASWMSLHAVSGGQRRASSRLLSCAAVLTVASVAILLFASSASAAECTTTWVGPTEGTWQTAGNWSTAKVPSSSDVACIGAGKTAKVYKTGSHQVDVVQGEGTLLLREGSLEVLNTKEPSVIKDLIVEYNTVLKGPATIVATNTFSWTHESTMEGAGATVVASGAAGSITTGGGWARLNERTLVNEGSFSINEGILLMGEGATFENSGTLTVNHESGLYDILASESGPNPTLINAGTVQKTSGTGETHIEVDFENEGEVNAKTGTLGFTLSGASGSFAGGSVLKGSLRLEGPSFTAGSFSGGEATLMMRQASLSVESGASAVLGGLTMDYQATIAGAGTLEIAQSLSWISESTMSGSGTTVLQEGASGTISAAWARLVTRKLINAGTLTLERTLGMGEGAVLENTGTFNANSEWLFNIYVLETSKVAPSFVNTGTLQKTSGTGKTKLNVGLVNDGTINAKTGMLAFEVAGTVKLEPESVVKGITRFEDRSITGEDFTVPSGQMTVRESSLALSGEIEMSKFEMEYQTLLTGSGDLNVTESFLWSGQSEMAGSGTTVLKPGTSNVLDSGATTVTLSERMLVNEGTFSQVSFSRLKERKGALIRNKGTYNLNSEPYPLWAPNLIEFEVGGGPARFINSGTFQRTKGTTDVVVTPEFENVGTIQEPSSKVKIENPISVVPSEKFGKRSDCGDPVECATGNFYENQTDFSIGGRGVGLALTRAYSAQAAAKAGSAGAFGYGWTGSFGERLLIAEGGSEVTFVDALGNTMPFEETSPGSFGPPGWSQSTLNGSEEAGYTLTQADQTVHSFSGEGRLEALSDRNGNETTLAYDESGRLEAVIDPAGRELRFAYNVGGFVKSVEDPMGNVIKYGYESGELISVTQPNSEALRWGFDYDGSHRITSMIDGREGETKNKYDAASRVISQTDPANRTLTFDYQGFRTLITNKGTGAVTEQRFTSNNQPYSITYGYGTADASTQLFAYDESGRLLSETDANGHKTTYTYNAIGDLTSVTDPNKAKTSWEYNETHDILAMKTPNGQTTTVMRDANGNPETVAHPAPKEATQTVSYDYGPNGELESMTDPLERTWSMEYNSQGDLTAVTDPEGDTCTWEFNENSHVIAMVSPRGNEEGAEPAEYLTAIEPDPMGRPRKVTNPLGHVTEYGYDGNGNLETETNPGGHSTTYFYNGANEPIKVEEPNGDTTKIGYDAEGHVVSQTDGNEETTTYARNVLGLVEEVIDPLSRKTILEYDPAGNLEKAIDAAERTTTYSYDATDQVIEVDYSSEGMPTVKFEYDPNGNVTSMADGSGTSTFDYDILDRLEEVKDGHGDSVAYSYDLANEQIGIEYPSGKALTRTFDDAGRLETVTDWLEGTTTFSYDADSNLDGIAFPVATAGLDEYSYDAAGWIDGVTMKIEGEPVATLSYVRDKVNQIKESSQAGLPGPKVEGFEYDENGRLIESGAGVYEYDAANNLLKAPGSTYKYDAASQLEEGTGITFSYNEVGERLEAAPEGGPTTKYAYDQAGGLTSVERSGEEAPNDESFSYNGAQIMTSHTLGKATNYLTWDTSRATPVLLADDQMSYVYGPGGMPIAQIDAEETVSYLHHDQLGSTRMITDATGESAGLVTYAPYGERQASSGSASSLMGHAGQYTTPHSSLQYLRARFYDPGTGQFLTKDPLTALTRSPYAYANGNPLLYVDLKGLDPCILGFIFCDETDEPCESPLTTGPMMPACLIPDDLTQEATNASAGYGDSILSPIPFVDNPFGGPFWRDLFGINNVERCSLLYRGVNMGSDFFTIGKGLGRVAKGTPDVWRDMTRNQNEKFVPLPDDIMP